MGGDKVKPGAGKRPSSGVVGCLFVVFMLLPQVTT